jgi:hypothetical protein
MRSVIDLAALLTGLTTTTLATQHSSRDTAGAIRLRYERSSNPVRPMRAGLQRSVQRRKGASTWQIAPYPSPCPHVAMHALPWRTSAGDDAKQPPDHRGDRHREPSPERHTERGPSQRRAAEIAAEGAERGEARH